MFLLSLGNPKEIATYALQKKWISHFDLDSLAVSKAGEGNMNFVVRLIISKRESIILKQSKPFVEKYPHIAAPSERILVEGAFYNLITDCEKVRDMMPQIIGLSAEDNIMALEDLGKTSDYTFLYETKSYVTENDLGFLITYLSDLHVQFENIKANPIFKNSDMRQLNHEHIFILPFLENNGLNLDAITSGLEAVSLKYKKDKKLKGLITDMGKNYLAEGKYLLHGDYYPGSWVKTTNGLKIIDPEFCFYGQREFDLGVLYAHLILTKNESNFWITLEKQYAPFTQIDKYLVDAYAGIEIMRRLLGVAQLPIIMDLNTKTALLNSAYQLITIQE